MDLPLNKQQAMLMHIDINSCFATIEQQANPFLRGKPVAVVAHNYSRGCVLAASIEAKKMGVKTGMILLDAKKLCPNILTRQPDPDKYRHVHKEFRKIISDYSDDYHPKSIDEFIINLEGHKDLIKIAKEIKLRIRKEVGEYISVSVGIGTNRFWAKQAAGFKKPDGLTLMDYSTAENIYKSLKLTDLHGINVRYEIRLKRYGIYSPLDFLNADIYKLRQVFKSVNADYWYTRLRGYQIDNIEFARKSFGNTYSMPGGPISVEELSPILMKLINKASARLRKKGFYAKGIHLGIRYKNHPYWHKGKTLTSSLFDSRDLYKQAFNLLIQSPRFPVANLAVTCFNLINQENQLNLFRNEIKIKKLNTALDAINEKWQKDTIFPARMLSQVSTQAEAIGFGNVKEII